MDPNISSLDEHTEKADDSLESLGLTGVSLMQLWGAGIDSVSELRQHTAESLRTMLQDVSDEAVGAKKRTETVVTDVINTMGRRQKALRQYAKVESIQAYRSENNSKGDTSEHEAVDASNTAAPMYHKDTLGPFYSDIRRYPVLSREIQIDLARRVNEEGDEVAREMLISHNLRLVLSIARRYLWSQLEYADLVQEGNIGLMIAVDKFDHTLGNTLSTYATWWIRQVISRFIQDYGQTIRVPVHIQELMYKVRRAMNELALSKGRPPTLTEIAEVLEITPGKVKKVLRASRMQVNSLDEKILTGSDTDGDTTFYQLIADEGALRADHVLEARQELDAACDRINELTEAVYEDESISERDREIFVRIYGLDGSLQKRTLEVVGEKYNVTRERVRQIIEQIWRKLQATGYDSDHNDLADELKRIANLEKLAGKPVSVN